MERPTDAGPRLFSQLHDLSAVYLEHPYGNRVAHSLFYHRLVLAQAERLLLGATCPYPVAYTKVYEVPDVFLADVGLYPAHRREGHLGRIAKKHVPTHQRGGLIDCFT